jgi:prepilin-type N-terminal cleavage/methylation domain-containing protein
MRIQRLAHARHGFTLIELMIVVAIIGLVAMLAAPKLAAYRTREDARAFAETIRGALSEARSQAVDLGHPTFVLFNDPNVAEWEDGAAALIVDDADGTFAISTGDRAWIRHPRPGLINKVGLYGIGGTSPSGNATPPAEDPAAPSDLSSLTQASSFGIDPTTGVPAVGFTTQGIPVDLNTPTAFGSGGGAIYVTDNESMVLAIILEPLGSVRVRVLQPGSSNWF